jgi:hypothetical protein
MRLKMVRITLLLFILVFQGCGSQINRAELLRAKVDILSSGMSTCGDNAGCQIALTAFVFGGGLETPREDGVVQYAAALLPYANLFLNAYSLTLGGGGSANAMYVKGSNNTFIGWNKASSDRNSVLNSDFGSSVTSYFNNRDYTQTGADGATTQGDVTGK